MGRLDCRGTKKKIFYFFGTDCIDWLQLEALAGPLEGTAFYIWGLWLEYQRDACIADPFQI